MRRRLAAAPRLRSPPAHPPTPQVIRSLLSATKYVIVVEHDLSVLDYLSDFICCLYGKPSAYGEGGRGGEGGGGQGTPSLSPPPPTPRRGDPALLCARGD